MNQRIKISDHFYLDEYVTPEFYTRWGAKCINWIRPEVISVDEFLHSRFGKAMTINNWAIGGQRTQSGLRYPSTTVGAGDSLHKFGVASDKQFEGANSAFYEEVRQDIIKHWKELYLPLGLTTIEAATPTWLHTDCRHILNPSIINIVHP
jgi:hypothetical protein